jgi:hypothetical protein
MAGGKETGVGGAIAALLVVAWHYGWTPSKIYAWLEKKSQPKPTIYIPQPSDKPYVPSYLAKPTAPPTQSGPAPPPTPKPIQAPMPAVPAPPTQYRGGGGGGADDFCDWCGCRGGPGYRAPNGQCVGKAALYRVCGNPPTTKCTYEGGRPRP